MVCTVTAVAVDATAAESIQTVVGFKLVLNSTELKAVTQETRYKSCNDWYRYPPDQLKPGTLGDLGAS
ncbi:hypothetical protein PCASD_11666 [Puccinia coronata f. sp. avenae]|uniref:Uncharacterized protein n=1 Tax=Puccinia coronata f. sp. avenae TaxID=200324 RepID=A0A2N5UEE3_9BASI|nr:hypothetical protein PCASD_11666 [Puccinia coronata f. sp. avenae]